MSIEVNIPPFLQSLAGGIKKVNVEGGTVGECLEALGRKYPQLEEKLFTPEGGLSKGLNIFINGQSAYPGEFEKPVHPGDKIHVTYVMLGG